MTVVQTYQVDVVYQGKDKGAQATADRLGLSMSALQGGMDTVARGIERVGMVAVTAIGSAAYGAVRLLASGVTGINADLEAARIGMAAVFSGGGVTRDFNSGLALARDTIEEIRLAAAAIPGETSDLLGIFRNIQQPALQAGASVHEIVEQSAQLASTAATLGLQFEVAGREYSMFLQGRAGSHVALWNLMRGGTMTQTAEEWNALSPAARETALVQRLQALGGPALAAYQHSWGGMTSTVMDFLHRQQGVLTAPLFEHMKAKLEDVMGLIQTRGPEIEMVLTRWGETLARWFDVGLERGTALVDYLRTHWRELKDELIHGAELVGRAWLVARGGSMAIGAGQAVSGAFPGLGTAIGAGTGATAAGIGAGTAALMAAPAIGAAAVAIVDGSWNASYALGELRRIAGPLVVSLTHLWEAAKPLVDLYGGTILTGLTLFVGALATVVTVLAEVHAALFRFVSWLASFIPGGAAIRDAIMLQLPAGGDRGAITTPRHNIYESAVQTAGMAGWTGQVSFGGGRSTDARIPGNREADRPHGARGHTTIHNHWRIEQADDPERLAITVQHVLEREMRAPTQAATPGINLLRP